MGRLFDPGKESTVEPANAEGLAQALGEALALDSDPQTRSRCRARAAEYGWDRIGPQLEQLYQQVAAGRKS